MADEDVEQIGGIAVSIGASHSKLVSDLAEADRRIEAWASKKVNIQIGATFVAPTGAAAAGGRPPAPTPMRFGAAATTGVQGQQGQTSMQRLINETLAKTGERLDENGEIVSNTTRAIRGQRQAIVEVQQAAAKPVELDLGTDAERANLQAILGLLREVARESREISAAPPRPATRGGGAGGGVRRRGRVRSEDDEDEVPSNIEYIDKIERQRRQAATRGLSSIDINRSEQSLARQRQREEAATTREQQRRAEESRRIGRDNERRAREASLQALTAQAAADSAARGPDVGSTFAAPMTEARRREIEADRTLRRVVDAERARRGAAGPGPGGAPSDAGGPPIATIRARGREERLVRAAIRAEQRRDEEVFARAAPDQAVQRERQIEERVARARANITASGRTGRTASSGIGALFGGTQGRLIEANARLAASDKAVAEAEKAALPFRKRMAEYDIDIANSSGRIAEARTRARQAFAADPKTVAALERERKAIVGQKDALEDLNKLQSGGNVLRNLAAISLGGAAFGVGLKAVDLLASAAGKALGNFIDIQSGFGYTSTRVTTTLGQQTLALHGNADAAIAAAAAQAGISVASTEALQAQLRLTTGIKAGAIAQQQASELFRAGAGVGNAPTGLYGGYGGVAGTSFLAQQLGGGRGFSETIRQDLAAFTQNRNDSDDLGNFNRGFQFVFDEGIRNALTAQAKQQGSPLGAVGDFLNFDPMAFGQQVGRAIRGEPEPLPPPPPTATLTGAGSAYINNLNAAAQRGAEALDSQSVAAIKYTTDQNEIAAGIGAAASAMDPDGVARAADGFVLMLDGIVASGEKYKSALEQLAVGVGIADPAALGRANLLGEQQRQKESAASLDAIRSRQEFELPSIIAAITRQTAFAANTQQPAQQALASLAAPALPVGTGIAPSDQKRVADSLRETRDLQEEINDLNVEGQQIIRDTYQPAIVKNFGAAAATAFDASLAAVEATGKQIAGIQAQISNDQAAYQVAQYNFQLHIARRTLGDIGGLIGRNLGAGESYLGSLQRQNLQLSRQAQLLQFQMSQRQINFQTAVAGFQTPGVTPEERQANIAAAKIEAEFAQKQLNIQREMFGNQVEIVDIGNLRQGRDLVRQIALLQQGRQVTIDTAAAEQQLQRLNRLQARHVARVGTYMSAVDNLVSTAFGHIQQLEAAAGEAMVGIATQVLSQFGIFINGLYGAVAGGTSGASPGGFGNRSGSGPQEFAQGGIFNLSTPTRIGANGIAGEVGDETLLILSRPRSATGTSGAGSVVVNFNGDIHTSSAGDLDKITQAVLRAMGRGMSTAGLRQGN